MQDENLSDLYPVCQDLWARVATDPVLAAQWHDLVFELREVFTARRSLPQCAPEGAWRGVPRPRITARS